MPVNIKYKYIDGAKPPLELTEGKTFSEWKRNFLMLLPPAFLVKHKEYFLSEKAKKVIDKLSYRYDEKKAVKVFLRFYRLCVEKKKRI